jgi:hypothetical protein
LDNCSDCGKKFEDNDYHTQVNPRGGYGREEVIICDECMISGKWDHWLKEHWTDWPRLHK